MQLWVKTFKALKIINETSKSLWNKTSRKSTSDWSGIWASVIVNKVIVTLLYNITRVHVGKEIWVRQEFSLAVKTILHCIIKMRDIYSKNHTKSSEFTLCVCPERHGFLNFLHFIFSVKTAQFDHPLK